MGRAEAEAALPVEWRATYPAGSLFCDDGMVDATTYDASPIQVAVMLRETNGIDAATGAAVRLHP